jgi:hypothetical protein
MSNSYPDSSPSLPTTPRTRTSPRLLALDEVQDIIKSYMEQGDAVTSLVLRAVSDKVEQLRLGHPKSSKVVQVATNGEVSKSGSGAHFVGIRGDEKPVYVHRDTDFSGYAHVYGPFNTKAGAEYAIAHDTYATKGKVL